MANNRTATHDMDEEQLDRIDPLCNEFEAALKRGERPRASEFLERAAAGDRSELLYWLLRSEIELRQNSGESCQLQEYLSAWPSDAAVGRPAFGEQSTFDGGGSQTDGGVKVDPLALPRKFGKYELLEVLGQGGMGVVYKATQFDGQRPLRTVALKLIRPDRLVQRAGEASSVYLQRFRQEALLATKLEHERIVRVYDVGDESGQPYFSMQYIAGQSLAERLDTGPLPAREAAELLLSVAEAIAYAHERGIVHRDLKPRNILLNVQGSPCVADFGLARESEGVDLSATELPAGTAQYMSPEQVRGKHVATAADIYGLGATLYELLTGGPPFRAATTAETLLLVLTTEPVAPRDLNPKIPRDLDTLCLKCLEKDPHNRPTSAAELRDELRRYLDGRPIKARPVSKLVKGWRWCARNAGLASLLALTAVLVTAVVIVSTVGYMAASRERAIAAEQREEARQNYQLARSAVDSFFVRITEDPDLRSQGLEPLRHKLLSSAQTFYEQMARNKSDDPILKSERAHAYMKLGRIASELGKIDDSKRDFEKALAIFRELAPIAADKADNQANIAQCLLDIGIQSEAKGEFEHALAYTGEALGIFERLHQQHPKSHALRNDYARVLHSLGVIHRVTGEKQTADDCFKLALAVREPLLAQKPANFAFLLDQSKTLNARGAVLYDIKKYEDATEMIKCSLAIREDLANRNPTVQLFQEDLAEANSNLASIFVHSGSPEKAEPYFQAALDVQQDLSRAHPAVPRLKLRIIQTQMNMGIMHLELKQFKPAIVSLEAALDNGHKLIEWHGEVVEYQHLVATCHYQLGNLYHESQEFALAVKHRQAVLTMMEPIVGRLANANPELEKIVLTADTLDNQRGQLSDSLYALALRRIWKGEDEESATAASEAVEILEALRAKYPDQPKLPMIEAETRLIHAVALARLGKHPTAAQEVNAALALNVISANIAYNAACALAHLSAAATNNPDDQERYATQAVAILVKGFGQGVLSAEDAKALKGDQDLVGIRERDDFQKLLREHIPSARNESITPRKAD